MKLKQLFKLVCLLLMLLYYDCKESKETNPENIIDAYKDSLQDAKNQINALKYKVFVEGVQVSAVDSTYKNSLPTDISLPKFVLEGNDLDTFLLESATIKESILKDINLQPHVLDDNATVKYKLNKDPGLQKIEIFIGGVKVDLSKDIVKGVRVFTDGGIWATVTVKQGVGNYTLELSDVQLNGEGKKWKVTPKPSESVNVNGSDNVNKNLIFNLKK